jgi:YoeB-like toxin of bacterial type II toxin-antitoxin system
VRILWYAKAWETYLFWQQNDPTIVGKINALINDIGRSPFKGIGKPEPLKGPLSGCGRGASPTSIGLSTVKSEAQAHKSWRLRSVAIIIERDEPIAIPWRRATPARIIRR